MPDGMGPDFLSRSMFFREAEAGPTQQQLATMTAPFGGSPEQALAFMQSPEMQAQMQRYGVHFDPSQIRQSPFLPNQFMHGHPMLGGLMNQALASAASTPEAPLVSGAGSGISRMAQGVYGGQDLLRQHQVRQMMAPMQAIGMQLPLMEEQRRRELLDALKQDMDRRRGMEEQLLPDKMSIQQQLAEVQRMRAEAAQQQAEAAMQRAQQPKVVPGMGFLYPGGGLQTSHPAGMPAELGGQVSRGGPQFQPFDQGTIDQYIKTQQAIHPERKSAADWKQALMDENVPEREAEYYAARAVEAQGKGAEAQAKAKATGSAGSWNPKAATSLENQKESMKQAIDKEFDPIRTKYKDAAEWQKQDPNTYNAYMSRLQNLEDDYTERGRGMGGTYQGYEYPGMHSRLPHQNVFSGGVVSPGAGAGGPAAGAGAGQPSASGLAPGYEFNEQGIPVRVQPQQGAPRQ